MGALHAPMATGVDTGQGQPSLEPSVPRRTAGGPIDGREVDPLPPHIRAVCGFLIVQRLMPQSQFNMGRNMWRHMAVQLFGIMG